MWLTKLALDRPVTIAVFMVAIIVLGLYSLNRTQIELQPKVDFPAISILTTYPGAAPDEIETLIAKPIEDAVSGVNGARQVTSTSQYGVAQVSIEFYIGTDIDVAFTDVQAKIEAARRQLPADADTPIVSKLDTASEPVMFISLGGSRSAADMRDLADNVIKDRVGSVQGVAAVSVSGGQKREIIVEVDRGRLDAYGLSINSLTRAIQASNLNLPSGRITEGEREYSVRVIGEFGSVQELKDLKIYLQGQGNHPGRTIRLSDVATVKDSVQDRTSLTRINGKESISLVVQKASDANAMEVSEGVRGVMGKLQSEYPDLEIAYTFDQATPVKESLIDLRVALYLAIILVVAVVYVFLYNVRGTFIVALAIPTCIFATFIVIYFAGFTINTMTMLALSLAVGILVDDSIVVIENIYRHLALGEEPAEAAFNGRSEIGLAAIVITFIDVAVFLPVAFMGGVTGQFFRSFGITVAVATLFSLLVSFTITPMLASRWYRSGEALEKPSGLFRYFDRFYSALERGYKRILGFALRLRYLVIIAANGALVATLFLIGYSASQGSPLLPFRFAPSQDQGLIRVSVTLPPDASLEQTTKVVEQVEQAAMSIQEVKYVSALVGTTSGSAFGAGNTGPRYADIRITLDEKQAMLDSIMFWVKHDEELRTRRDEFIADELRSKIGVIPGAQVSVNTVSGFGGGGGGGFGAPIQVVLSGRDTQTLVQTAENVKRIISEIPGVKDPDLSWSSGKPELQVRLDRERMAALGVTASDVAFALRTSYEGNIDSKFREFGREYNIRVQLQPEDRARSNELSDIVVAYAQSQPIRLRDVGTVSVADGPTKIERTNRQRQVTVSSNLLPGFTPGNVQVVIERALEEQNAIPPGVAVSRQGENEVMAREGVYMGQALLLAFILVYLLMAALFENWLYPFIIQFSQPQALVGALLALIIAGSELNIVSMIGIIMLIGLVGKNAILLVDYTNTLRRRGLPKREALLEAGPIRLRPIMMTTIAMVLGMLPIALAIGRGSEFRAPLGIAVIGGLIVSTLLTLVVIPCTYYVFDDISSGLGRLIWRRKLQPASTAAAAVQAQELSEEATTIHKDQ